MYIDLEGSHAHEGTNELVSSLMEARHPLDTKMQQAEVAIFKVRSTHTQSGVLDCVTFYHGCRVQYLSCQKTST